MARNMLWAVLLTALVIAAPSARADYEAGQRAWEEGRPDVALTEWRSAAASGDRRAMLALGRLFVQGLGAPQDYVEAHMWLNLAASRGEAVAAKERDVLAAKMSAEQVATAQARATAWRPGRADRVWTRGREAAPAVPKAASPPEEPPARVTTAPGSLPPASLPSKEAIREAQELLAALGYAPGSADGIWGKRSTRAYTAFLRDAGLPAAETLNAEALRAMRDKASRKPESKEAIASTEAPRESSQASSSASASTQSGREAVAALAELAMQGLQAYMLVKMMEDPKNFARVAPELKELLGKMVSGLSAADLSNKGKASVVLGALTPTERSRLSDLLTKDEGLPEQTRAALSDALRAKGAAPTVAFERKCAGTTEPYACWAELINKPGCHVWDYPRPRDTSLAWSGRCSGGVAIGQGTLTDRTSSGFRAPGSVTERFPNGTVINGDHARWVIDADGWVHTESFETGTLVNGKRHGRWVHHHGDGTVYLEQVHDMHGRGGM